MNLNRKHYYLLLGTGVAALLMSAMSFITDLNNSKEKSLVYIDNVRLFNNFNMALDISKQKNPQLENAKKKLDSLYTIYQIYREQDNVKNASALESIIREQDLGFRQISQNHTQEMSTKIWDRLNQYVKEYAELNEYEIVFGTRGDGNIMFARNGTDITAQLLAYANAKYEGS